MTFVDSIKTCTSKWITFSGRASRSEFWWFNLFVVIVQIVWQAIFGGAIGTIAEGGGSSIVMGVLGLVFLLVYIYLAIAAISATVRRLHDRDKTGWWYWLFLVPIVGAIILIVWFCMRGTQGPNRYGPDPLGGSVSEDVFE